MENVQNTHKFSIVTAPDNSDDTSPTERTKSTQKRPLKRPEEKDNFRSPWSTKPLTFPREESESRSAALRALKRSESELKQWGGPHRVHGERSEWKTEEIYTDSPNGDDQGSQKTQVPPLQRPLDKRHLRREGPEEIARMDAEKERKELARRELFSAKNLRAQLETDIGVEESDPHYFGEPKARCEADVRQARKKQRAERKRAISAKTDPIEAFPLITQWPEKFPERSPNRHGLEPRKINLLKGAVKRPRVPIPMETPEKISYVSTRFYDRADQGLESPGDIAITKRVNPVVRSPTGGRGVYSIFEGDEKEQKAKKSK